MYPALHEVNTVLFEENRNTTFIRMVRLVFALQCRYLVLEKKWTNYIEIEKEMASLLSKYFFPCLVRLSCCCLICLTFFFICWIDLANKENYFLNIGKSFQIIKITLNSGNRCIAFSRMITTRSEKILEQIYFFVKHYLKCSSNSLHRH